METNVFPSSQLKASSWHHLDMDNSMCLTDWQWMRMAFSTCVVVTQQKFRYFNHVLSCPQFLSFIELQLPYVCHGTFVPAPQCLHNNSVVLVCTHVQCKYTNTMPCTRCAAQNSESSLHYQHKLGTSGSFIGRGECNAFMIMHGFCKVITRCPCMCDVPRKIIKVHIPLTPIYTQRQCNYPRGTQYTSIEAHFAKVESITE